MDRSDWLGMAQRAAAIGGAAAMMIAAGGCYTRIVGARGPGADQYNISEPYQQDTRLDRWFYGEEKSRRNRSLLDERSSR